MNNHKVALVTGVSSGIGREIARLLTERGLKVFGTSRRPGAGLIRLDVTDDGSVAEAVRSVLHQAGRIDVLVNNAGYALAGALEGTSIDEARQQFDTNFFGVLRVTQAVLPVMRRQGYGRIVNISSMNGLLPAPYRGAYAASKHALEGYTETLDHEIRSFGIRALLVEPIFTKTNMGSNEIATLSTLDAYANQKRRVTEVIKQRIARGDEPRLVAEVVYRAVTAASPHLRYPVGEGVKVSRLRRFVPARMSDSTFRKQFHLDESAPGRDASRATTTSDENRRSNYANDRRQNRATTRHESLRPT